MTNSRSEFCWEWLYWYECEKCYTPNLRSSQQWGSGSGRDMHCLWFVICFGTTKISYMLFCYLKHLCSTWAIPYIFCMITYEPLNYPSITFFRFRLNTGRREHLWSMTPALSEFWYINEIGHIVWCPFMFISSL